MHRNREKNYPWNAEQVKLAVDLYREGKYASEIATALQNKWPKDGKPSRNAVIGKIARTTDSVRENKGSTVRKRRPAKEKMPVSQRIQKINKATANELERSAPQPPNLSPLPISNVIQLTEKTKEAARKLGPIKISKHGAATVATINARMCHYPIGDPMKPGFAYCGRGVYVNDQGELTSYCEDHRLLMYDPKEKERKDKSLRRDVNRIPKRLRG